MADAKIGSTEWFTGVADRLINTGLDVLLYKTTTKQPGASYSTTEPSNSIASSGLEKNLPYILGGVAVVGIGLILWKR